MVIEQFSKREALAFGWNILKNNFWFWVLILLTIVIVSGVVQAPASALEEQVSWGWLAPLVLLGYLIQQVIYMGQIRIVLKFCDGEKPDFIDLFTTWRPVLKAVVAGFLYGVIIFAGLLLFIIPGIIWAIRFQFYLYHIVDHDSGPIEALRQSFALTKGHTWNLFLLAILSILICILGFLALLLGLLAAVPVTLVAQGYAYRWLSPRQDQPRPAGAGPVIWSQE